MSAVALAPPGRRDDARDALLWGAALLLAVAAHLGLAWWLMARPPGRAASPEELPAIQIDMAPPAAAPTETDPSPRPTEAVPESAAPDPVMEEVPDVPEPDIPPPSEAVAAPMDLPIPELPPPAVVPPNPAVVLPPKKVESPPVPKPGPRTVAEKPKPPLDIRPKPQKRPAETPRPVQAQRRGERVSERRAPTPAAGARARAPSPVASSGASAANSADWQRRLTAYLQSRLRYPGGASGGGSTGVAFSVTRGGQIFGGRVARSSGNPAMDAAAVATAGGAVPPPPAGYAGSLSFVVSIRFNQR